MRILFALLATSLFVIAGCVSAPRSTDLVTLRGRIVGRAGVAAAPKWSVNESYTVGMVGAVGVAIAHMRGVPKHYVYTVSSGEASDWVIHAKADFSNGTCLAILVPKVGAEKATWQLDEVELTAAANCR